MKNAFKEVTILFLSLVKWLLLASFIGAVIGTAIACFSKILDLAIGFVAKVSWYIYLLPIVLFLACAVITHLLPKHMQHGHGTDNVIKAIHKNNAKINIKYLPIKLVATITTIAGGGSAGKEGPSTLIGASIASFFSSIVKLKERDRKVLVICGLGSGFAAVFGTPIAGAIFALEVLVIGRIMLNALFPALVSAISSVTMCGFISKLMGSHGYFKSIINIDFSINTALLCIVAGIIFGIVAISFIKSTSFFEKLSSKIKIYPPLKALLAGGVLCLVGIVFGTGALGLGENITHGLITGDMNLHDAGAIGSLLNIGFIIFALKIITTSITLSFGGSGGIISPTAFIGTAIGALVGMWFGNVPLFAALGFVAVLSGGANTPIAAIFLGIEMFGFSILPYIAIVSGISYVLVGSRSLFPTQVVATAKSMSLVPKLGVEVGFDEKAEFETRSNKFFDKLFSKLCFWKKNNAVDEDVKIASVNEDIIENRFVTDNVLSGTDIVTEVKHNLTDIENNIENENSE